MPQAIGVLIIDAIAEIAADVGASAATLASITALTTATIVTGVTYAEVIGAVALTALSLLLAPGVPALSSQEQQAVIQQGLVARRRFYGLCKVGGVKGFLDTAWPPANSIIDFGDLNNYLFTAVLQASQTWDSTIEHWLGDGRVRINLAGKNEAQFVNPSGTVAADKQLGDGTDGHRWRVTLFTSLGEIPGISYQALQEAFSGMWTPAHKLSGVVSCLKCERAVPQDRFSNVYPQGPFTYNRVARTAQVWDPRDPDQDVNDPSTWKWTMNGPLIVMDYLWHIDGMHLPIALITAAEDDWIDQINKADVLVKCKNGGSVLTYALSGGYDFTATPRDVLPQMLSPMAAHLRMRGDGAITLRVGEYVEPTVVITRDQILAIRKLQRGQDRDNLKNEIRARFTYPNAGYSTVEADPWRNEDSIDVFGIQSTMLDLGWSQNHNQTRRIQKIESYRQDPEWSMEIDVNAYGLNALGETYIRIQIPEFGIDLPFEKLSHDLDITTGKNTMGIRSIPEEAFQFNSVTEEGNAPALTILGRKTLTDYHGNNIPWAALTPPQNLTVVVQYNAGQTSAVIAAYVDPYHQSQETITLKLAYRTVNDTILDDDASWTNFTVTGFTGITGNLSSGNYKVRAQFVSSSLNFSLYAIIDLVVVNPSSIAPTSPTAFTGTADATTATLHFTASSSTTCTACNVYRTDQGDGFQNGDLVLVVTISCTPSQHLTYVDTPPIGSYDYWVTSTDANNNESLPVNNVKLTVPNGGTGGTPNIPTGLQCTGGLTDINSTWNLNPVGDNVTAYHIYMAPGTGQPFSAATQIGVVSSTTTQFDETGLQIFAAYTFFLKAENANGLSAPTAGVTCNTSVGIYQVYPPNNLTPGLTIIYINTIPITSAGLAITVAVDDPSNADFTVEMQLLQPALVTGIGIGSWDDITPVAGQFTQQTGVISNPGIYYIRARFNDGFGNLSPWVMDTINVPVAAKILLIDNTSFIPLTADDTVHATVPLLVDNS